MGDGGEYLVGPGSAAPEVLFTFSPPTTGLYVFDLCGSEVYDTYLHIWDLFPNGTLEKPLVDCQNNCTYVQYSSASAASSQGCPDPYKERLELLLNGGEDVAVLVEKSFEFEPDGLIQLSVECPN
eukprot:7668309-Prorocentrum_lima.AAC.1